MVYDVVIIGAGLAGMSAALKVVTEEKNVLVVAKGSGALYSASGHIDLLGYYPHTSKEPSVNPLVDLEKLIMEKPEHPYSLVGKELVREAFASFVEASKEMGLPYNGSLEKNKLFPTAAGAFAPTCLYPESSNKKILEANEIIVVGIKELIDFYPQYVAKNLEKQLQKNVSAIWVDLEIPITRELNSYDIAITIEQEDVRKKLIDKLKDQISQNSLILFPAILGVRNWSMVINELQTALCCDILEIPTMPPSVMGYRLAETYKNYLEKQGVTFIVGSAVTEFEGLGQTIKSISILTKNGRKKKIAGNSFILATGGILGGGLKIYPEAIKENILNLPIYKPEPDFDPDFFSLNGQPYVYSGVIANNKLQPVDLNKKFILYNNLFVAGATLAGYDPFIEKSGNGVAIATGYKAGLMAVNGGAANE